MGIATYSLLEFLKIKQEEKKEKWEQLFNLHVMLDFYIRVFPIISSPSPPPPPFKKNQDPRLQNIVIHFHSNRVYHSKGQKF